jgi:hypothetical protein
MRGQGVALGGRLGRGDQVGVAWGGRLGRGAEVKGRREARTRGVAWVSGKGQGEGTKVGGVA